jgi:hypothetical protein
MSRRTPVTFLAKYFETQLSIEAVNELVRPLVDFVEHARVEPPAGYNGMDHYLAFSRNGVRGQVMATTTPNFTAVVVFTMPKLFGRHEATQLLAAIVDAVPGATVAAFPGDRAGLLEFV